MSVWPNFQPGFLSSRGLHCWLINELCDLSFKQVGWLKFSLLQGTRCIVSAGSPSSGLRIEHRFFFWIPYSSRNLLVKFQIFFQSVGNQFNRFYQAAPFYKHIALFRLILSHPGQELSAIFFCQIPYSSRNLLVNFQNFSQSVELVGNRFNKFYQAAPVLACFDPHFCCGLSPQAPRHLWATFRVRVQFGQISCGPTSWMGRMWVKRAWFGLMEFRGMCVKESKPFISFRLASLPLGYEI